jgi:hypothetical protein
MIFDLSEAMNVFFLVNDCTKVLYFIRPCGETPAIVLTGGLHLKDGPSERMELTRR